MANSRHRLGASSTATLLLGDRQGVASEPGSMPVALELPLRPLAFWFRSSHRAEPPSSTVVSMGAGQMAVQIGEDTALTS